MIFITKKLKVLFKPEMIDFFWSVSSTLMKIGGSLLLLPIILNKFSVQEIGLWYFFTSVSIFVLMIDFGFSSTMSRNIRYVLSKGRIYKIGVDDSVVNSLKISLEELFHLIKKIYKYISLFAVFILFLLTFLVVELIKKNGLDLQSNISYWIVYCISIVLNLRYYYGSSVLIGLNKISKSQQIEFYSLFFNFFISFIFIYLGIGLLSLALGNLAGFFCRFFLLKKNIHINDIDIEKSILRKSFNVIWPNTWRTGISNVLGYLIRYLSTYFVTFTYGLDNAGTYGLTFQCINVIVSFSFIWIQNVYPRLNSHRIEHLGHSFYKLFYKRFLYGILSYVFLSSAFLIFLKLDLFSIRMKFLPQDMIIFLIIHMLFDLITNMFGYIIMTGNNVPFIKSSLLNVIMIIGFNFLFKLLNFGLWGILFSNFLAGLIFSYWYWIYKGSVELNMFKKNSKSETI
jgi:O-antigen/teichoic acid export membrane protein